MRTFTFLTVAIAGLVFNTSVDALAIKRSNPEYISSYMATRSNERRDLANDIIPVAELANLIVDSRDGVLVLVTE